MLSTACVCVCMCVCVCVLGRMQGVRREQQQQQQQQQDIPVGRAAEPGGYSCTRGGNSSSVPVWFAWAVHTGGLFCWRECQCDGADMAVQKWWSRDGHQCHIDMTNLSLKHS